MADKDSFQKYLDVGIAFTNMTRTKAEELVADLVQNGEFQGKDARAKVDELIERSRKSSEALLDQVRHEVTRQLDSMGITTLEDLATQVATLLGRSAEAGRTATKAATKKSPGQKAPVKKAPVKKAPAKKAPAKKSKISDAPVKNATAKTATAKKAAAKKSPAKKAAANTTPVNTSSVTAAAAKKAVHDGSSDTGSAG